MVGVYGWIPVFISCWVNNRIFCWCFFKQQNNIRDMCRILVIKTSFSAFDMFLLCSLENWNQHFFEVRAVSLGSNKCIFDEFRVFWDTFAAKGVQMVLWFNPSTASKKCPTVWLVHAIITQIYRDAAKSKRNNICHPTSYRATLAIPVRISGWTIRFVFNLSRYGL